MLIFMSAPNIFFSVWHWLTIFGPLVYHHEMMCHVHSWSQYNVDLRPQGQIYRFVSDLELFLDLTLVNHIWHMCLSPWEPLRGSVVYIYDPNSNINLWPKDQLYRFLSCLTHNFCLLWHWLTGSITMRRCVIYTHDPDTTLTFDLKINFIGFMTWLCVWPTAFLSVLCS